MSIVRKKNGVIEPLTTNKMPATYPSERVVYSGNVNIKTKVDEKQASTDNSLDTTSKQVVGAINELNSGKVDKVQGKGLSENDYTDAAKAKVDSIDDLETKTGNPISFTTDSAQLAQDVVITFEPIETGSGEKSPNNPYTISGYNSADIAVPRENQWDEEWEQGYFTDSGVPGSNVDTIRSKNYIGVLPNTTYYFKSPSISSLVIKYVFYDSNRNILSVVIDQSPSQVFTTPNNAKYMRFSTNIRYGGIYNNDISINYPSTDTSYHAYNPVTDISLKLVEILYGGIFNVKTGEMVVDKGFKVYNGSENWEQSANPNACRILVPSDMDTDNPDAICDTYTYTTTPNDVNYGFAIGSYIAVKDITNCSTVADFKTYLSGHNITFVYKLKNPITLHLPPQTVELLKGANVVITNGNSMTMKYRKGEIAKLEDFVSVASLSNSTASNCGTSVDLTPYTSSSNRYTFPLDGYVVAATNADGTSGTIRVAFMGANDTWMAGIYFNATIAHEYRSLFVKKGMKAQVTRNTVTGGTIIYYPLT